MIQVLAAEQHTPLATFPEGTSAKPETLSGEDQAQEVRKMTLPAIGETITTGRARDLCQHFGFVSLVQRIDAAQPNEFRDWVFDGASILPDDLVAKFFHIPHLVEISLKHDLKYAYGEPNNAAERLKADEEFKQDLLNDSAHPSVAEAMFKSVRLGGSGLIKTSFSWGFARR